LQPCDFINGSGVIHRPLRPLYARIGRRAATTPDLFNKFEHLASLSDVLDPEFAFVRIDR